MTTQSRCSKPCNALVMEIKEVLTIVVSSVDRKRDMHKLGKRNISLLRFDKFDRGHVPKDDGVESPSCDVDRRAWLRGGRLSYIFRFVLKLKRLGNWSRYIWTGLCAGIFIGLWTLWSRRNGRSRGFICWCNIKGGGKHFF